MVISVAKVSDTHQIIFTAYKYYIPDGADFESTSAVITIPPDQSEGCAELPITDDNIALEDDETFEVLLQTPPGVTSSSPSRSTVTILDNDGMFEGATQIM